MARLLLSHASPRHALGADGRPTVPGKGTQGRSECGSGRPFAPTRILTVGVVNEARGRLPPLHRHHLQDSEVTAAVSGSIGIAPSANLDPEKRFPSLFEPVLRLSAPDIAGQGITNPSRAIWAASLLLEHAGQADAGRRIFDALEAAIANSTRTRDLGGSVTTDAMTEAVIRELLSSDRGGR